MTTNKTDEPDADADGFFVPSHTWFLAPFPRPSDQSELIGGILTAGFTLRDGREGTAVPLFTDLDLAERYAAKLDEPGEFKPLAGGSARDVAFVLHELQKLGETHVIYDPEPAFNTRRMYPIVRVIEGIAAAYDEALRKELKDLTGGRDSRPS